MRRYVIRACLYVLAFYLLVGVVLCETTLRLAKVPIDDSARKDAQAAARASDAELETVETRSQDGLVLRGWFFRKRQSNGDTVLLLHGQGDNRAGMIGYARLFLAHQYSVLDPDMRAHGESGGTVATYGVSESDDVHRWMDWLAEIEKPRCVFGLGESMGAAILLQSLRNERRFCAVAAESSFSSFREIAYDRIGECFRGGTRLGRTLLRPAVELGYLYARIRYGVNLEESSPAVAIAASEVPVLLIHGKKDEMISPRHSRILLGCRPRNTELWEVPNTGHTEAYVTRPDEFERRVTEFFTEHTPSSERR